MIREKAEAMAKYLVRCGLIKETNLDNAINVVQEGLQEVGDVYFTECENKIVVNERTLPSSAPRELRHEGKA